MVAHIDQSPETAIETLWPSHQTKMDQSGAVATVVVSGRMTNTPLIFPLAAFGYLCTERWGGRGGGRQKQEADKKRVKTDDER